MVIDRDKHNKYVVNHSIIIENILTTTSTDDTSSSTSAYNDKLLSVDVGALVNQDAFSFVTIKDEGIENTTEEGSTTESETTTDEEEPVKGTATVAALKPTDTINLESTRPIILSLVDNIIQIAFDTDWLDDLYVNIEGDTMTGMLTISTPDFALQLTINRDNAEGNSVITYSNASGLLGYIGICGSAGTYPGQPYFSNGTNDYKIWTSGNDGSGSGLDADLLDGLHSTAFALHYPTMTTANDADLIRHLGYGYKEQGWYSYGPAISFGVTNYIRQIQGLNHSNVLFTRKCENGTWSNWEQIALTSSNVASATQLQTARTIWGQSFDGTANVSGNMTGVGSIRATGSHVFYNTTNGGVWLYPGINANEMLRIDSATNTGGWRSSIMTIYFNGNVGIGTLFPELKLHVIGNIIATGEITANSTSDIRLKTNIHHLSALDIVRRLNVVEFDWTTTALLLKADKTVHGYGLIALEVESLIPEVVAHNMYDKGYLGIDYLKLVPFALSAIQEVDDEVAMLKRRVTELEYRLSKYEHIN